MNMIQENELELESVIGHDSMKQRSKRRVYNNHQISAQLSDYDDSVDKETEFTTEDDQNTRFSSDESTSGEDFKLFEDYSCPGFEPFQRYLRQILHKNLGMHSTLTIFFVQLLIILNTSDASTVPVS
ncbi:unnamed protein product [Rhizophagus irregularis]|nr:unnamed protein product [Rhizophagus irregularis]